MAAVEQAGTAAAAVDAVEVVVVVGVVGRRLASLPIPMLPWSRTSDDNDDVRRVAVECALMRWAEVF